ncbi:MULTISPECIES: hypothetical protein [Arthrobacter]|uniref:Uncharacterized protein n=1 Tax=Arthrobacter psychrochitiniphilus TaxID=291045 RepID=A0A2V3DQ22_9MICC|nr:MULTISPECIES: hypothetical protein [Arthrobacter]NYG18520.1 hypothetical protein [Arthrobacter psychrochitiniphilus]PXA64396.1 hypothetical protein CVS29_15445 [Arthrobacter psychrochitiniphilus]
MHHTGGPGWRITMDTCTPMLMALYFRDVAGLLGAGTPSLSQVAPAVRSADHSLLISGVGGDDALRGQWEYWWSQLLQAIPDHAPSLSPPDFPELAGMPALQRVAHAHFGSAVSWSREQAQVYSSMAAQRETMGAHKILADLVQNREMELGRSSRDFTLIIVEVPLAEPRAWFIEPNRLIMSSHLLDDPDNFRSYVQPVVNLLV